MGAGDDPAPRGLPEYFSEPTGFEAKTIHRLLEVDPRDGGFRRGEDNPLSRLPKPSILGAALGVFTAPVEPIEIIRVAGVRV
jgi:hypothetical protein